MRWIFFGTSMKGGLNNYLAQGWKANNAGIPSHFLEIECRRVSGV